MKLDILIEGVISREGSTYTNDPNDSGGPTKFGITLNTLARYLRTDVTPEDIEALTEDIAKRVYKYMYWYGPKFDRVAKLSIKIAEELLDTGVHTGPPRSSALLQRALNGLNNNGQHWRDIAEDGDVGPATLNALQALLKMRGTNGETVMLRYLNGLQVALYDDLVRRRPKDENFMYGWLLNRVTI